MHLTQMYVMPFTAGKRRRGKTNQMSNIPEEDKLNVHLTRILEIKLATYKKKKLNQPRRRKTISKIHEEQIGKQH